MPFGLDEATLTYTSNWCMDLPQELLVNELGNVIICTESFEQSFFSNAHLFHYSWLGYESSASLDDKVKEEGSLFTHYLVNKIAYTYKNVLFNYYFLYSDY